MTLETTVKRYIGLASDRKPGEHPMPVGGETTPPAGSTFLESDTGTIYRYHDGAWQVVELRDETAVLLGQILAELRAIHLHLQLKDGFQAS